MRRFRGGARYVFHKNPDKDRDMCFLLMEGLVGADCRVSDDFFALSQKGAAVLDNRIEYTADKWITRTIAIAALIISIISLAK